jgi:hypothetical protein
MMHLRIHIPVMHLPTAPAYSYFAFSAYSPDEVFKYSENAENSHRVVLESSHDVSPEYLC